MVPAVVCDAELSDMMFYPSAALLAGPAGGLSRWSLITTIEPRRQTRLHQDRKESNGTN